MLEGLLIGIIANIITGAGQSALKKIINNGNLENEINKAFSNALSKWTENYGKKEFEKIYTQKRFSQLIECVREPEKINSIDKSTADLISYFKLELQKSTTAWNFIQDTYFQNELKKLNAIELHLRALIETINNQNKISAYKIFDDALVPYLIAFKHQLDKKNENLPNQFHNKFIGRKSDLENLDYLIKFSNKKIVSIISDGGYGKTRLCIEYFQKYIDDDPNYEAFVLDVSSYKSLDFATQLKSDKNILILIDDAHKNPQILNEIASFVNKTDNLKLILTIRKAVYDDSIKELSTHNRGIDLFEIKRLTYEETQSLFRSQLPDIKEVEIRILAAESKGIPIVVLGLCQVTINGKYNSGLSEEKNFVLFVRELKEQVINDIHKKYLISKENIHKTIQLLSFFSPLKNSEKEIYELSILNGINVDETNLILDYLHEYEFIYRGNEIYINPDPYSDTILIDSASRIKYILNKNIKIFLDRLIRNLVEVEQSQKLGLSIDYLLFDFVSLFNNKSTSSYEEIKELESNLETLKSFTYKKPQICFKAIKLLVNSKSSTDDFWKKEEFTVLYSNPSFEQIHEHIETILSIAALNSHKMLELDEIYELLWIYQSRKSDSKIFQKVFKYRVYDFYEYGYCPYKPCERQTFLINKLSNLLKVEPFESVQAEHIFVSIKNLLVLDFEDESYYDKYTHEISWARPFVIYNETTKGIRLDALKLLISLYERTQYASSSKDYLEVILRILAYTAKNKIVKYEFNQEDELKLVIQFLRNLLNNNPTIIERSILIRQLKLYEKREIKEEYITVVQELLSLSENVETPKERLTLMFLDEYFSLKSNIGNLLRELIEHYSNMRLLFIDIIEIKIELSGVNYTNFHVILSQLIDNYPVESKNLLDFVIENYPDQMCDFYSLIKANYKDQKYFYLIIGKFWELKTECAISSIFWMLTYGRNREIEFYKDDDLKYVEFALKQNLYEALWNMSSTLPKYILINPEKTIKIIANILKVKSSKNDHLIISIFDDEEILKQSPILIKNLIFNETLHIPLDSYYFDTVLNFLENTFNFDTMFEYLQAKIIFIEKKEDSLSLSLHKRYHNQEKQTLQSELDFLKVIKWYSDLSKVSDYLHKEIVKYLRPIQFQTNEFKLGFKQLIENEGNNIIRIIRLCNALDVYESKNEFLVSIFIEVSNELCQKYDIANEDLVKIFGSDFVNNFDKESVSYFEDDNQCLQRKEKLIHLTEKYPMHIKVDELFKNILDNINNDFEKYIFTEFEDKW